MKKLFYLLAAVAAIIGIAGCASQQEADVQPEAVEEPEDFEEVQEIVFPDEPIVDEALVALRTEAESLRSETIQEGLDQTMPDEWGEAEDAFILGIAAYETDSAEAQRWLAHAIELYRAMLSQAVAEAEPEAEATPPLPAFYLVDEWVSARDCFWSIAENPAVYGNPYEWRRLYEANRDVIPNPENPNLIMPGTLIRIPSIGDEYREGTYDPSVQYGSISGS